MMVDCTLSQGPRMVGLLQICGVSLLAVGCGEVDSRPPIETPPDSDKSGACQIFKQSVRLSGSARCALISSAGVGCTDLVDMSACTAGEYNQGEVRVYDVLSRGKLQDEATRLGDFITFKGRGDQDAPPAWYGVPVQKEVMYPEYDEEKRRREEQDDRVSKGDSTTGFGLLVPLIIVLSALAIISILAWICTCIKRGPRGDRRDSVTGDRLPLVKHAQEVAPPTKIPEVEQGAAGGVVKIAAKGQPAGDSEESLEATGGSSKMKSPPQESTRSTTVRGSFDSLIGGWSGEVPMGKVVGEEVEGDSLEAGAARAPARWFLLLFAGTDPFLSLGLSVAARS